MFDDELDSDCSHEEAQNYVDYVKSHVKEQGELDYIFVQPTDDGLVDVSYRFKSQKFERIRRVTGYLTGSLDSWNDAKRAEERDRVKHANLGTEKNENCYQQYDNSSGKEQNND